ncbi:GOLPH3/VPS74 family protein [Amycolatopsis sp. lyj-112]|uniref:GOLPH3/VPS74 family protein n=1 Tax=Amycolatopsis sp. lyj-112 TaxID=2789288 RepID=UPI00397E6012
MDLTLPQRLYLLIFNLDKNKLDSASALVRGQLMRAGAMAELTIAGLLGDQDGKVSRDATAPPPGDPFLAEVFDDVSPDKPRSWFRLVDRNWHKAEATVRDQLEAAGTVTVTRGRMLGVFPTRRIALGDPRQVAALRENTRNAVLLGRDPATLPIEDAVVAVLAADGDLYSVFTPKERRAHKPALTALRDHVDATLPGLRKAAGRALAAYLAAEQELGRVDKDADPAAAAGLLLGACLERAFLGHFIDAADARPSVDQFATSLIRTLGGGLAPR